MYRRSSFGGRSLGRRNIGRRGMGRGMRRGGGFRWPVMLLFAIGAAFYYFSNQETVPFTDRKQLRTMDVDQEMQLGLQSYQQILSDNRVVRDEPVVEVVREIGARIARAAAPEEPGFEWAFNVID